MNRLAVKIVPLILAGVGTLAPAQVTYTGTTSDDAFLATGSPSNPLGTDLTNANFGAAGVLYIAPATSPNGEYQSVLKFDLSGATNLFAATYGSNWTITAISLKLTGNVAGPGEQPQNLIFNPISDGNFVIEWLADDNWVEGTGRPMNPTADGVTYASLPALLAEPHDVLCTNTYVPPGDSIPNIPETWPLPLDQNLVTNIADGGPVSFRFYAADNQVSYLFNSHNYGNGNQPLINITASPLLKILSGYFTNGIFHLAGMGGTNTPYQVQASTNLNTANWQVLGTATSDITGAIRFDDPAAASHNQRYYRLAD
jgi:hypothetical protein